MAVRNIDVARIFDEVADLLEVNGSSYFRVRAYRNASRVIRDLSTPLNEIEADPDENLEDLPGIGRDLARRIREILETGDLELRLDLEAQLPATLLEVMKVPGLGPRKTHELYLELGINDLKSLERAARNGGIRNLKGFGAKTEGNILRGIQSVRSVEKRVYRAEAESYANRLLEHMRGFGGIKRVEIAGSYRRLAEGVADLDLVACCEGATGVMEHFLGFPETLKVISTGPTRASVVIDPGLQADLRLVDEESFGSALQYYTGSSAHNVILGRMAARRKFKLNKYGVFRDGKRVAGRTEEEVYAALDLPWIPPELRENRGEIRLAAEGLLPDLVEPDDIRGDLHVHTDASDGRNSLEEMAVAARERGYGYIAVTNHSKRAPRGMDGRALLRHWEEVEEAEGAIDGIRLLKGVEVEIHPDGRLDLPDEILAQADYVVASVHYDTGMSRAAMTGRIVWAMKHPLVNAIGHPTGKRVHDGPRYEVYAEDLVVTAARTGTFLEVNAAPDRLDPDDLTCRSARDHGVIMSASTDAHSVAGLDCMRHGVNQARRGWLERLDVLNSRCFRDLTRLLKSHKRKP